MRKVLIFGDTGGISQLIKHLPSQVISGLVAASNRPKYHDEIEAKSKSLGVPFIVQPAYKSKTYKSFVKMIDVLDFDIILVNSYSMILRTDVLDRSPNGAVNIHAALLPMNRGCNPIQWAIINGQFETGVSLHKVDENLDTGPIIDQIKVPILFDDQWDLFVERLAPTIDELIHRNLDKILSKTIKFKPQDESIASHGKRRKPEDSFFCWHEPILDIYNKIRALLPPLPAAFFYDPEGNRQEELNYCNIWQVVEKKYKFLLHEKNVSKINFAIRPVLVSDTITLSDWWLHPHRLQLSQEKFETINDCSKVSINTTAQSHDTGILVIEDVKINCIVGIFELNDVNWKAGKANLNMEFHRKILDHDLRLQESLKVLIDFCINDLKLKKIKVDVNGSNIKLSRSLKLLGFKSDLGFHGVCCNWIFDN